MTIEEIVEKLGDNFDEVRQNMDGTYTCYLRDTRRYNEATFRKTMEVALNAHEETKKS